MIVIVTLTINWLNEGKLLGKLRVAMLAPPWLMIPPKGYGGIEAVLDGLINGLKKLKVDTELFSIKPTKIKGVKNHYLYEEEQYQYIHRPLYDSLPIILAHTQFALNYVKKDGKFDIIHDHNGFLGPFVSQYAKIAGLPPIIHTLHGPPFSDEHTLKDGLPDNRPIWQQLGFAKNLYLVGISDSLVKSAPKNLLPHILPTVHNAVDVKSFPFRAKKGKYFITLARFSKDKGQHIAAKFASELGMRLKMAGSVAGISSAKQLTLEIANPLSSFRNNPDFRYFSDKIFPILAHDIKSKFIGNIEGSRKMSIVSRARALLFPIDWEEPFGMAVIEALACGTPVVAMNRGAMPEIIDHGVNGFLANSPAEFKKYMQLVDEIDPYACRKSVENKFSAQKMAKKYLKRYETVIQLNK